MFRGGGKYSLQDRSLVVLRTRLLMASEGKVSLAQTDTLRREARTPYDRPPLGT
jgi:hypothetical protein